MIIPYTEIQDLLKGSFVYEGDEIFTKHSVYNGEREFALVLIEKCMGLLQRQPINDLFIIQYLQGLLSLTNPENNHYYDYLEVFVVDNLQLKKQAIVGEKLSLIDRAVIKELMTSNIGEYITKGEYQSCCYTAMLAFFQTVYCILEKRIDFSVKNVDIIADLDDELDSIQLYADPNDNSTDIIIVNWHSSNKINSIYMLYKNQYSGLDPNSILELVSADVIEEDYYFKDERFSIAPSILTKQYCAIIEHEVNEIIQLKNLPNKPRKHLMWRKMKEYVKDNNIDLSATDFSLLEVLEDLYDLRNKGAHGEIITKEEYNIMSEYKNSGLFYGISTEKLRLKNGKIHPTIDEIHEYMGY